MVRKVGDHGGTVGVRIVFIEETQSVAPAQIQCIGKQGDLVAVYTLDPAEAIVHVQCIVALPADVTAFDAETAVGVDDVDGIGGKGGAAVGAVGIGADIAVDPLEMGAFFAHKESCAGIAEHADGVKGDVAALPVEDGEGGVVDVVPQDEGLAVRKAPQTAVVGDVQGAGIGFAHIGDAGRLLIDIHFLVGAFGAVGIALRVALGQGGDHGVFIRLPVQKFQIQFARFRGGVADGHDVRQGTLLPVPVKTDVAKLHAVTAVQHEAGDHVGEPSSHRQLSGAHRSGRSPYEYADHHCAGLSLSRGGTHGDQFSHASKHVAPARVGFYRR